MFLKFFLSITGMLLFSSNAYSQALVNNFAEIYIKQGAKVFVKTNSVSNNDLIDNSGELTIEQDFINNDTANGGASSGIYHIQGNWINNSIFIADQSLVRLYGANQLITGSEKTAFYDLTLTGTGIKRQTINSETRHHLSLNDRELATDFFDMLVSNTDTGAISRTAGFVSSLDTGKLSRSTNSIYAYLFPTGSSINTFRYRPVKINPFSSSNNIYGVRLANIDATSENYNRTIKTPEICEVNPLYYHRIYHQQGNDIADLEINYDAVADGNWQDIAHWQNVPEWERTNAVFSFNTSFSTYVVNSWSDFSYSPFALARLAPSVDAGRDTTIVRGESVRLNPTINGVYSTIEWIPPLYLNDHLSSSPISSPDSTITYTVILDESNTCRAEDNITINIIERPGRVVIPQAFSPNNDGFNDFFLVLNPEVLESIDLKIFNRWGQIVFETRDTNFKWDGTYKGVVQDLAVFVWMAEARTIGATKKEILSGNITLIK